MAAHPSKQQLEAFRRQTLAPVELLAVDDHLAGCAACRQTLETALSGSVVALHADLQTATATAAPHLSFAQLAGYVDETLDRAELPFVADHAASCAQCAHAVDDLRAFKATDVARPVRAVAESLSVWQRLRDLFRPLAPAPAFGWALAVLLLAALAVWLFFRRAPESQLANQPTVTPTAAPSIAPVTPAPETAPLLAQLNGGGGRLTLDQQGNLSGLETLPVAYQQMVKEALTTQQVARADLPAGLNRRGSSLMGADEQGNRFSLQAPVGKVVLSDRPLFKWTPLAGAVSYVVEVYNEQFKLAAHSGELTGTNWTPPQSLARGRAYAWQVKAAKDGQEISAPKPPAPQARFRVLDQTQAQEIAQARRQHGEAHLLLGLLYARAGLLDEAERELRALQKANPDSALARKLAASVAAQRR